MRFALSKLVQELLTHTDNTTNADSAKGLAMLKQPIEEPYSCI